MARIVEIPVSYGDLVDRITILQIKAERINETQKLENILRELRALLETLDAIPVKIGDDAKNAIADLRLINQEIWDDEDLIRLSREERDIACIAVRIFKKNDRRHAIKRELNELMCSDFVEEKSY